MSEGSTARRKAARHEADRVEALSRYAVVGTGVERAFDDLAELAAHVCNVPMALVSLVAAEREWFKARVGVPSTDADRGAFCDHVVASGRTMVVADTLQDPRFAEHPLTTGAHGIRFYAGAPLVTAEGHVLGALCVLDTAPRTVTDRQVTLLEALAAQVMDQLERRRESLVLSEQLRAREADQHRLAETRRVLDAVLQHSEVFIYAKDLEGRYVLASDSLARACGRDVATTVGSDDRDLFPAEVAAQYQANDAEVLISREQRTFEEYGSRPDGSTAWSLSTKFPLVDSDGKVYAVAGVTTDVTELYEARRDVEASEQRWRALVEQSPVAVAVYGAEDFLFRYANAPAAALYGLEWEDELIGRSQLDVVPIANRPTFLANLDTIMNGRPVMGLQTQMQGFDGVVRDVEVNAALVDFDGHLAIQVELRDISARAAAERALLASQDELRAGMAFHDAVLAATPDVIYTADPVIGATLWSSRNMFDLLGYTSEQILAMGSSVFAKLIHPEDLNRMTSSSKASMSLADGEVLQTRYRARTRSGEYRWLSRRVTPFARDETGQVTQVLGVARDITDVVDMEERLFQAALHDALTGLPNRTLLDDRLRGALARSSRTGKQFAVLFCDLDGFKAVNDTGGHQAGDEVLRVTADRLRASLRAEDTIARVGGDEFVIILEPSQRPDDFEVPADVMTVTSRLLEALGRPVAFGDAVYTVTASIGVAIAQPGSHLERILRSADAAMYQAKSQGKNQHAVAD